MRTLTSVALSFCLFLYYELEEIYCCIWLLYRGFLNKAVIYILLVFVHYLCYMCKYTERTDTAIWFCIFGVTTKKCEHLFFYNYQTFYPVFLARSHNNK